MKYLVNEGTPTLRTLAWNEFFQLIFVVVVDNEVGNEVICASTEIAKNYLKIKLVKGC